jgi:hypothetical protein
MTEDEHADSQPTVIEVIYPDLILFRGHKILNKMLRALRMVQLFLEG